MNFITLHRSYDGQPIRIQAQHIVAYQSSADDPKATYISLASSASASGNLRVSESVSDIDNILTECEFTIYC
jgi:hypothetical protein